MRYLLDTNIAIYLTSGVLRSPLPQGTYMASVISEIELLSKPGLTDSEFAIINSLLESLIMIDLGPEIRREAAKLRRETKLRLPDAVIAATAIVEHATLLSNDESLQAIAFLSVQRVPLKEAT